MENLTRRELYAMKDKREREKGERKSEEEDEILIFPLYRGNGQGRSQIQAVPFSNPSVSVSRAR